MALSQKRKFQDMNLDNLQHLLECSLCFHEFDEGELKPKFLICSHTFCQKCLQVSYSVFKWNNYDFYLLIFVSLQALSFSMKILCPLCRTTTPVGKGVSYLATNNYVLHILRTSNSTDLAILVSKCEEKDSQILQLQTENQLLEIKNQELEEKMKQQQLQAPKLVLVITSSHKKSRVLILTCYFLGFKSYIQAISWMFEAHNEFHANQRRSNFLPQLFCVK